MNDQITAFPKIHTIGSVYIPTIFHSEVEITEKIDGSQFCFGVDAQGEIVMRSRGQQIFKESHPKDFDKAVELVESVKPLLRPRRIIYFYGEYLRKEKHNVLSYDRVPKGNLIIFGVKQDGAFIYHHAVLSALAADLGLEVVPLLYHGKVPSPEFLGQFLNYQSVLGKEKVEGIVIKNYQEFSMFGGCPIPAFGKYVRADFKERHSQTWSENKSWTEEIKARLDSFCTEARWQKSVQHLKDQGLIIGEPKDIGPLIKEITQDVLIEEVQNIKEELFKIVKPELLRRVVKGFPEWYKASLLKEISYGQSNH